MDRKRRMIQQGRFQKNIQRYQRKTINVQCCGKSEMRVFQKGGRSQHSTYCKVILSEGSAGEMTGVEATPEWFEESADGKNRMETESTQPFGKYCYEGAVVKHQEKEKIAAESMNDSVKVFFPSILKI